jgi:hypothetical protein
MVHHSSTFHALSPPTTLDSVRNQNSMVLVRTGSNLDWGLYEQQQQQQQLQEEGTRSTSTTNNDHTNHTTVRRREVTDEMKMAGLSKGDLYAVLVERDRCHGEGLLAVNARLFVSFHGTGTLLC